MWKFRGTQGICRRVEHGADIISAFARAICRHPAFCLACQPCPFNVNFFYLPLPVRKLLQEKGFSTDGSTFQMPAEASEALSTVAIDLKLRLQEKGEMLIPYQPLRNQSAQVFRVVISGMKEDFGLDDVDHILTTMDRYGSDL